MSKKKEQKEETKKEKSYEAEVVSCYFNNLIPVVVNHHSLPLR
jgi:hypothetical protein